MRIVLFSETYFPEVNGVVSHVKVLREGLEKLGHEVLVVTTDANTHHHYVSNGVLYCPGKKMKKIYGYGAALPMNAKRYKYIKEFDPDVMHIHTEFGIGLFGLFTAKILKKPVIYTLHTVYDEYLYYVVPKMLKKASKEVFYKYIKQLADRADIIIGPSKKSEEYLMRAGVNKSLLIVPNGVDVDKFNPRNISKEMREVIRDKYNIPKDAFVGCCITRIGKEKSIDVLLQYSKEYIRANDDYYLLIVGDGPSKKELEKLAIELGIDKKVIFTGKVLNKDILPYYGASDITVTASLSEINSISMLEGMAMGLPVVQRYDEINKDQVIDGVNGYTFNSAESMMDVIDKIRAMEKEEIEKFKISVRNSVVNRSSQDIAKSFIEIYNKAIEVKKEKKNN